MSILSTLEAVPNRVHVLARLVAAEGPLSRDEAHARMMPNIPLGDPQFANLVRETAQLRLLEERDKKLHCPANIKPKDLESGTWFINYVEHELFVKELPEDNGNRAAAYALAWLMTRKQNYEMEWNGEHNITMQSDLEGADTYGVTNSDRSAMLAFWARYTGYAVGVHWKKKRRVIPDPTVAILRRLPKILPRKERMLIDTFVDKLGELAPVLDRGRIRAKVDARLKVRRPDNLLSSSLSVALIRMRARGLVEWDSPSDAKALLLDKMYDEPERISYIWSGTEGVR